MPSVFHLLKFNYGHFTWSVVLSLFNNPRDRVAVSRDISYKHYSINIVSMY